MARYRAGLETRDRILTSTRELLARGGLEAATLKAICDRARVQPGSFYNLFPTKEEAVLTVVREAITAVDPDPTGSGADSVASLVEAYIGFITDEQQLARVYLRMAVGGGLTDRMMATRVLRHHQARVARFRAALQREEPVMSAEENELRAEALVAALNGYALQSLLDPDFDFAAHARRLVAEMSTEY